MEHTLLFLLPPETYKNKHEETEDTQGWGELEDKRARKFGELKRTWTSEKWLSRAEKTESFVEIKENRYQILFTPQDLWHSWRSGRAVRASN